MMQRMISELDLHMLNQLGYDVSRRDLVSRLRTSNCLRPGMLLRGEGSLVPR